MKVAVRGVPTFGFETVGFAMVTAIGFFDGEEYYEWYQEKEDQNLVWVFLQFLKGNYKDRKSTRLNSSHIPLPRMPSSA